MKAETLRSSILQWAIEGKLVPQLDTEPGVAQIGDAPENIPFAIPEKWKWVRIHFIGNVVGGGTPKTTNHLYWENGTIDWFTPSDLGKITGKYAVNSLRKITEQGLKESSATLMPEGSILYSSRAPIGHIAISTKPCCTNQGCKSIVPNTKLITNDWAYFVMIARTNDIKSRATGTTFKEISAKGISETYIPLPPLAEQRRIVARLNELLPLVAAYGQEQKALEKIEKELPDKLRASLLQEAIQGKLVPQLDTEPEVAQIGDTPENIPFAIPEKWKWVRIHFIGNVVGGGTPKTTNHLYWENGTIDWFTPSDLGKITGKYAVNSLRKITEQGLKESSATLMPEGSILYSSRAPIGHIAISTKPCCTNQGCKSIVPNTKLITNDWAYFVMIARTNDIKSRATGTTFKEISAKGISETYIPLPPLAEQRRIVARLNELLAEVDRLKA